MLATKMSIPNLMVASSCAVSKQAARLPLIGYDN